MIIKDDEYYKKELSEDIMNIMLLDRNKEPYTRFKKTLKDLKQKKCIVKSGWKSGSGIGFTLIFDKHGNGDPYSEFLSGIENKSNVHNFIMGLNPKTFHFKQETVVNNKTRLMLMFKLKRDE